MIAVLCGVVVHMCAGYENCSSDFSSQCQCGEEMFLNKRQYVVNCTNTGLKNALLLQHLPPATQVKQIKRLLTFCVNYIHTLLTCIRHFNYLKKSYHFWRMYGNQQIITSEECMGTNMYYAGLLYY